MTKELLGKEVTAKLNEELKDRVVSLKEKGIIPRLAIVRIGENPSDISYEKNAIKRAELIGVEVVKYELSENISKDEVINTIEKLNRDKSVHGVLMFRPLPGELKAYEDEICNNLDPAKDIDGITDVSNAGVFMGSGKGFAPCTPTACMEILKRYNIDIAGKRAVVIGRSLVVGKPVAMMLMKKNATVTICHTKTKDMANISREADILIVAAGKAEAIGKEYLNPNMTVIDVGINYSEEKHGITGDVNYEEASSIVSAITPVPGGVGTVTTSVLIGNVIRAAEASA